jgi:ligand-binding sensor domain-containing protein
VDLAATSPHGLGGWRFELLLTPGTERTLEWTLTPAVNIAGKLLALDGKTTLDHAVVELVRPEEPRKRYTSADGLAGSSVSRVFFASEGTAWFATIGGGLSRFDGREFTNLTKEDGLPGNNFLSLDGATNGGIWMLANEGPGWNQAGRRHLVRGFPITTRLELTRGGSDVRATPDGAVWVRTPSGLLRYEGKNVSVFTNLWRAQSWPPK